MSKILHIVSGIDDIANGMVVVARLLARVQGDAEVIDLNDGFNAVENSDVEEVWVHGMWLPKQWAVCWRVLKAGKRLVRMTHGSLSPVYLKWQSPFKKWLVGPVERYFLRKCDKIIATCEAEKEWIESYLGKHCPPIEVTDIKRFFDLSRIEEEKRRNVLTHNILYLGRRHPLKGVEYLEAAVAQLSNLGKIGQTLNSQNGIELKVVSNAFGEEKEKIWKWCDVLVLPTLSDNFGLVIAEALERGKRVITTDGAPAWGDGLSRVECVEGGEILSGYDGRLIYLKGYRNGAREERVKLLKKAIEFLYVLHQ